MVRQHEGIWPLRLTTAMKGQITHSSFTQDWHHLSPSIFITSSHTLCYTPSLCLSIPFLLLYKAVTHWLQKSLSLSLIQLSTLSFTTLSLLVCDLLTVFAAQFSESFNFSIIWVTNTHSYTHNKSTHTHLIGAQSQLIRAGGPSLLMNLRVIKEPLDTGVSASCF